MPPLFETWKDAPAGVRWPHLGSSIHRLYFWRPRTQPVFLPSNLSDADSLQIKQWRTNCRTGWSSGFLKIFLHDENLVSVYFHCEDCPFFLYFSGLRGVLWFCGSKLSLNLQTAGDGSICNRNKSVSPRSTKGKESKIQSDCTIKQQESACTEPAAGQHSLVRNIRRRWHSDKSVND